MHSILKLTTLLTGCAVFGLGAASSRAAAPVNDNFADCEIIAGSTNLLSASNVLATREAGEPNHLGNSVGASLWWTWMAPDTGPVTIDTTGSEIDTLLAVYTGDSLTTLSLVAENDDLDGQSTSGVAFVASAGTVYQIAVDGFQGNSGAISLNLRLPVEPTSPTIQSQPSDVVLVEGTITNVTFKIEASGTRPLAYHWQFNNEDILGATASSLTITNPIPAQSGSYRVVITNPIGMIASSNATLTVHSTAPNDFFAGRIPLTGANVVAHSQNRTATHEEGDPTPAGNPGGHSVWWTWTAPSNGLVALSTVGSSYDTILGVYTGQTLQTLQRVADNDDHGPNRTRTSSLWFRAQAGSTYQVCVDGYFDEEDGSITSGDITLNLSMEPQDNDFFAQRLQLGGAFVNTFDSNLGATREANEPSHGAHEAGHSVWFSWEAPDSGPVTVDTLGSEFPATFGVYTGASLSGLTLIARHDDTNTASRIRFQAASGVQYHIVVDGTDGAAVTQGLVALNISQSFVGNDDFETRTPLLQSTNIVTGNNIVGSREPGEPNHTGNTGGRSLWWSWIAPNSGPVTISTVGSSFDTLLAVYTGGSLTTLELVAQNDDFDAGNTSQVQFNATAGVEYQIAVDGYGEGTAVASGTINLSVKQPIPSRVGSNDNFADRVSVSGQTNTVTGSSLTATKETGEPDHSGNRGGRSLWWSWVALESNPVTINTVGSSFDTIMGVYTGNDLQNLTLIESDDDAAGNGKSAVTFIAIAGVEYQIAVDGYGDNGSIASGDVVLNISQFPAGPQIANDEFANRTPFLAAIPTVRGSNIGATREANEPDHMHDSIGASVWWSWVAPEYGRVTLDTLGSGFDTVLSVYTGSSISDLRLIAANDDIGGGTNKSSIQFEAEAGVEYQIAVEGYAGKIGSITLNLLQEPITSAPSITQQPRSHTRFLNGGGGGTNVTFEAVAVGTLPLAYQWQKDGADLPGEIARTLTLSNAGAANIGKYHVRVTNALGSVLSDDAAFSYQAVPFNDAFAARISIAGISSSTMGSSLGASKEIGEPFHAGNLGGRSVWWTWTAPANGPVAIDTYGSSFDTGLAVYEGSQVNSLTLVAENDDLLSGESNNSFVTFNAVAGHLYQIAVDGFKNNGLHANIILNLRQPPAPPQIVGQPEGSLVMVGANILLEADTTGVIPLFSYQWFKGQAAIAGATNSVLALQNVSPSDRASYHVVISNDFGSVTSGSAEVWVRTRPPVAQRLQARLQAGAKRFQLQFADNTGTVSTDAAAFVIQYADRLEGSATVWTDLPNAPQLVNGNLLFEDDGNAGARFYRVFER